MRDVLVVELPDDLADELIDDGFEEFIVFRGPAEYADAVLTVVSAGLAAGANAATIIVARDAITQFVAAMRAWVRRKAASRPAAELTLDISARHVGTETRLRLEASAENGSPEIDTAALTALITSLFADKPDEREALPDATPSSLPSL
jgi:hypothetical protein